MLKGMIQMIYVYVFKEMKELKIVLAYLNGTIERNTFMTIKDEQRMY